MLTLKLAYRNVLRNKRRSFLTLLSMSGGFFLLCVVLSVTEGSYTNIIDIFTKDHVGHIQIHKGNYLERPSIYKTIQNSEKLIDDLRQHSDVVSLAPRILGASLAYGKNKTFPAQIIGIDPLLESQTTRLKEKVKHGHYLTNEMNSDAYFPAMIGYTLAKNLNLTVGDELILISQGIDGSIANDIFQVSAIVGSTDSVERNNVYLGLPAMREFLSMGDQVHEIAIILKNQSLARDFAGQINKSLAPLALTAEPWQVVETAFYKGMQADKQGSYVSLTVIILIVSIGVLNTVLMGTLERTREFGVLTAIGTRPISVFSLIMIESGILAIASCLVGLLISLPVNYYLSTVGFDMPEPIDMGGMTFDTILGEISWYTIWVPTVVVLLSTMLVSLIPSIKAAKISPLTALQAE